MRNARGSFLPKRRLAFALLAALALAATGALAPPAQAAFPGANGKMVLANDFSGKSQIYVESPDGSVLGHTPTGASDSDPAWSPDGSQIVFVSNRDGGNFEIYKMNADYTNQTPLTYDPGFNADPVWSPDGTQIAFTSGRDGNFNIFKMSAGGGAPTRLTNDPGHDGFPAWSPDGTKIAFQSDRTGNNDIYTMNTDGTVQTDITNNPAADTRPSWSPNGTQIAFASDRDGKTPPGDIYKMNADGSSPIDLSFDYGNGNAVVENSPAWSPDGTQVAETVFDLRSEDIYLLSATRASFPALFDQASVGAHDESPDWQSIDRSYARPKGATPLFVSLVPAYKQCSSPNTTHRGSISSPSCYAPTPESSYLTVGTPDFNGQGANSIGSVLFRVHPAAPEDTTIAVSYTDVRCLGTGGGCAGGALADYTADLGFDTTFRITDKGNGPFATGPATNGTVTDLPLRFSVPCTTTASTTIGSTCSITTSIVTVLGSSAIVAGQRAIWQLNGDVKLYDGGQDGVSSTRGDDTLFAVGGLFNP
jgi:Tol biopolymer transport system component